MNEIKVLDLFSGIGGFSLGLERAGPFRTVAFCEQDKFCQAVLRKHWPDVPIYDDVRTIDADGLGRIDLVCGGFPCQPFSVAGQRRGAEDDRDLWPEMLRIIETVQSRWIIGENVRGFINDRMGLQRSLSDLESIGYSAVPFIIPACAVDAPHRRDRVWIVGHSKNKRQNIRKDLEQARPENKQIKRPHIRSKFSGSGEVVADADHQRLQRQRANGSQEGRQESPKRPAGLCNGTASAERWATEPELGRVAHGIRNRAHRLRALGNAVVPQVVTQIGKAILAAES